MDFPKPPPSLDNLLKRVGEFLPQMEKANHDLNGSDVQLDAALVADKEDDTDTDSDDNGGEWEAEKEPAASSSSEVAPTIELKVSLGKLEENPVIGVLADGDSSDENGDAREASREQVQKASATTTLLSKQGAIKLMDNEDEHESKPIAKKRKVLIEELS